MSVRIGLHKFIERSNEIHNNKYDYSLVNYINNRTKIKIICLIHGIFEQTPDGHLSEKGCPKCGVKRRSEKNRGTTKNFIERSNEIHNNKYDYSLVEYINNQTKIKIICPIHGEFLQTPHEHLKGSNCYKCRNEIIKKKLSSTTEEFILKANEIHNNKYDYSKVEYINNQTKIKIICPIHGEFLQTPSMHLSKKGCKKCGYIKNGNAFRLSIKEFVERSNHIHNNKYDYSKTIIGKNVDTKIKIICPEHREFKQKAGSHLSGRGCSKCNKKGVSKVEKEIVDFIKSLGIDNIIENDRVILDGKELDIYLPDYNLAIEFDGLYWHNQQNLERRKVNAKKYHLDKTNLAHGKGIRLVHIFEDEWTDKQGQVKSRLKHFLGFYEKKIGARETKIKDLNSKERRVFLDRNHIQGMDRVSFSYGAYYNNKLIGVMSFCKPRVSMGMKGSAVKVGMYELSRFAVESGWQIYGLASKMFKHFIREEEVNEVYTYSDLRWNKIHGTGTVYEMIGMEYISRSSPSYFYIKDGKREYRFKYRKNVLNEKLKTFDKNLTEYQNCLNDGLDRVFDCGCDKFIWRKGG